MLLVEKIVQHYTNNTIDIILIMCYNKYRKEVKRVTTTAGERDDAGMTASEEIRLIEYLRAKGWTDTEILKLIEYIRK